MKKEDIEHLIIDVPEYFKYKKDDAYYNWLINEKLTEVELEDEIVILSLADCMKIQQKNIREAEKEYVIQLSDKLKTAIKLLDEKDKQIDELVKLVKELQNIIKEEIL